MSAGSEVTDMVAQLSGARRYELGFALEPGMPVNSSHPPFHLSLVRRHGDVVRADGVSTANELILMGGHTGTHIDAVGHASFDGIVYGGVPTAQLATHQGLTGLGAEELPPIFAEAVLFDVAAHRGVSALEPAEPVSGAELAAISERDGLELRPGSCALIRTGWGQHWSDPERYKSDEQGLPGPDESAAKWMLEHEIILAGSDTLSFEVVDPVANRRPVHRSLLVEHGVYIVEALALEELARDGVRHLLLCVLPLRIRGATGSPIRPVGLVPTAT